MWKSINNPKETSLELNVPLSSVHNFVNRFTTFGTVDIDERDILMKVQVVDKEP